MNAPFAETAVVVNDLGLLDGTMLCEQTFQGALGDLEEEVANIESRVDMARGRGGACHTYALAFVNSVTAFNSATIHTLGIGELCSSSALACDLRCSLCGGFWGDLRSFCSYNFF